MWLFTKSMTPQKTSSIFDLRLSIFNATFNISVLSVICKFSLWSHWRILTISVDWLWYNVLQNIGQCDIITCITALLPTRCDASDNSLSRSLKLLLFYIQRGARFVGGDYHKNGWEKIHEHQQWYVLHAYVDIKLTQS